MEVATSLPAASCRIPTPEHDDWRCQSLHGQESHTPLDTKDVMAPLCKLSVKILFYCKVYNMWRLFEVAVKHVFHETSKNQLVRKKNNELLMSLSVLYPQLFLYFQCFYSQWVTSSFPFCSPSLSFFSVTLLLPNQRSKYLGCFTACKVLQICDFGLMTWYRSLIRSKFPSDLSVMPLYSTFLPLALMLCFFI